MLLREYGLVAPPFVCQERAAVRSAHKPLHYRIEGPWQSPNPLHAIRAAKRRKKNAFKKKPAKTRSLYSTDRPEEGLFRFSSVFGLCREKRQKFEKPPTQETGSPATPSPQHKDGARRKRGDAAASTRQKKKKGKRNARTTKFGLLMSLTSLCKHDISQQYFEGKHAQRLTIFLVLIAFLGLRPDRSCAPSADPSPESESLSRFDISAPPLSVRFFKKTKKRLAPTRLRATASPFFLPVPV